MKRTLILLAALAAGAAGAASFEQARPVWPAASDGLPNENVRFAASFAADGCPLVLKATGATQYKIRLDGETIGWGPARAPEGWARMSEIPLAAAKGHHELVFEVSGYNVRSLYCNIPQPAYLQAELVDADGKVLAATGKDGAFAATWISSRHRKTARFSSQRGFVECWTFPEKNEKALALSERPAKRLTVRRAPEPDLSVLVPLKLIAGQTVRFDPDARTQDWFFVRDKYELPDNGYPLTNHVWDAYRKSQQFVAMEEMRPVSDENKLLLKSGVRLRFDGGIEKTGFVRMKVKAVKPGKLWFNWSELLVNGKVNAFKMRNADISVWEFTEPGEYEIETMEPYALRYLEATAEEGEFELSKVSLRLLESPEVAAAKLPRTGDAEMDEIFAAARNTLAQNALDTFMDCPGRERAAWLCDSFFSAKGFFALTGSVKVEKDFLENWLLPDAFGDLPEGMLPMTYPSSATSGEFIPNWAMWYVLQLEDYLKRSGDRSFADAMKPRMAKLLKFFRQYRNSDGLLEKLPSWVFIEWSAANEYVQDVNYPANMTWAGVLEAYGRMYGDAEATAEAAKIRKAVFAQSFNGRFFRDHAKRWADGSLAVMPECTETCQDYALYFRLGGKDTPGDWYRTVLDRLGGARPYDSDALPEISKSAPFIGDVLRLLALSELGEKEILKRDLKAFYLAQARRTGTLWETQMDINSNCHGFAGGILSLVPSCRPLRALCPKMCVESHSRAQSATALDRPQTWFHLIGGNVSKEGIVADLDAIAAAGFGGVQFFHGQFGGAWPHVAEQIPCLSEKWDDIVRFTATEAKRRGLAFTVQNCPGWSYAGGPWVPVEGSMRILDATRTDVKGGAVDVVLPKPAYPADKDDRRTDFRDLRVIAFPKLAGEAAAVRPVDFAPVHLADTNSPAELRYDLGREVTVRSVVFDNPKQMCWCWQSNPVLRIELFAETAAGEAKLGDWNLPMMSWQDRETLTLPVEATAFRRCRFRFTYKSALHLDGISFLGEARYRSWESEAGYANRELMKGDEPASIAGEAVGPKTVVDLTDRMDASGRLVATLPAGEWTVLRVGHASNGFTNAPAPKEVTGFECDKLSPEAAKRHFAAYAGRLAAGPLEGRLDGVLVDSWECGFQNWTAEGLDVRTADWPALFGYVVGDRAATRAFYRGWRNRLSRKLAEGFYRTTSDLVHSVGGRFWCEVGPGEVFPGDPMEYFKYADVPMCEFWLPLDKAGCQFFDRPNERYSAACVSAAHLYGKRRVAAESFTSCVTWNEDFKLLKETVDAFFSLGVTHPVFHTYTHNPATDLPPPGTSFGEGAFGCPFLRGQTWWPHMRHFTDYLTRCTTLLERGVPANDVLMYLGDDVNALPRTSEDGAWEHPAGFAVDYLNRDALMNRLAFRDGRAVTPEGARWRALWIPEGTYLESETERRFAEAEKAGVPVLRGKGSLAAFLAAKGLQKDFDEPTGRVRYIHRRDGARDIYFVCANRASGGFAGEVRFGAKGAAVVYDPVKDVRTAWDGRTLALAPGGSCFVIFGETGGSVRDGAAEGRVLSVDALKPWTLSFPAGWGAPEKLTIEKLVPWCELPVGDEAKAFSGTVTYRTGFRGAFAKIDLGRVETIAEVKVNGKSAGTLWCEPYVADVAGLCTEGENELEIAVTSTWHNRLWYDGQGPEAERKTWTLPYPKKLSAGRLLPYGLLGKADPPDGMVYKVMEEK